MHSDDQPDMNVNITIPLVRQLVDTQFPCWAELPITNVEYSGWDNRTFRLGNSMSVRLPSAAGYAAQVRKEQQWLPRLAPLLPLPIPVPLAMGVPTAEYPWHWSIYRWLEGQHATLERIADLRQFALALADFLVALYRIDATGGPIAGEHNSYRGGSLRVYDAETRQALDTLAGKIDTETAAAVWEAAINATWLGPAVWVHGDVAAGNLLVDNGRLSAVIDFGSSGVGDPACDLVIAWTLLSDESREAFRQALPLDNTTWARARGWALWKGLITLDDHMKTNPAEATKTRHVIEEVIAEHVRLSAASSQ